MGQVYSEFHPNITIIVNSGSHADNTYMCLCVKCRRSLSSEYLEVFVSLMVVGSEFDAYRQKVNSPYEGNRQGYEVMLLIGDRCTELW